MVVKSGHSWFRTMWSFQSSGLKESWPRIFAATLFACVITLLETIYGVGIFDLTPVPFSLTGVAIGIFLGFRSKTAYDRFWEGRTLWGALVNSARSLARLVLTLVVAPAGQENSQEFRKFQTRVVYHIIGFVNALRHHLRDTLPWDDLRPFVSEAEMESLRRHRNVPLAIVQMISQDLAEARRKGWVHEFHVPILEREINDLTDIQGGCERIRNTPVPHLYAVLSHRVVFFFCFCLPLGIVDSVHGYTPFVVFLVSHAFFGLDVLGTEIEEPFGIDQHDLPLAALCRTIEVNLRQLLGETEIPEFLRPVNDVLI